MTTGVMACQRHIESKARAVFDGYARTEIGARNIPGVSTRLDNLVLSVGLDPTTIITEMTVDTLPQVDFYAINTDTDYDAALQSMDVVWTYQIGATVQYDEFGPEASAQSAAYLASTVCEVFERRLADPSSQGEPAIWMVQISTPVSTEVTMLEPGDSRVHTMRATAEIEVYSRVTYQHAPAYQDTVIDPFNPVLLDLSDATIKLDAATLDTLTPMRSATVTTTTAALAGATSIVLDVDAVITWDADAAYTVSMTRHDADDSGTLSVSNTLTVTLAEYDVEDGDNWIITIIGPKNRPITWAIEWSVS